MTYFFFGTLRDLDVLEVVIGRSVSNGDVKAAEISGYRLVRVIDESYPALVGDADGRVEGVFVSGLKAMEIERLAWFEGKEYMPKAVEVRLTESGEGMEASIQVPTQHLETTDDDWEFQSWKRNEKEHLISLTRAHMALFGNCSLDEAIDAWDASREELEAQSTATTRR